MNEYSLRVNELKNVRAKHIKKLTKILNLLVKTEWEITESSMKANDNPCTIAAKSVANASSFIQTSISQLISTDVSIKNTKKVDTNNSSISSLKKVVLNKK